MAADLEVIGKHAMLFDDDTTLEFVNSKEALIEWNNSLFIDRFDVRNLITVPPPSFRNLPKSYYSYGSGSSGLVPDDDSYLYPDLDIERFADLRDENEGDGVGDGDGDVRAVSEVEAKDVGGYKCVPFSYGKTTDSTDPKDPDMGLNVSSFHPSFPVPEHLLQSLPPTERLHQIIARTATFVGEHGGQSEIVLRVKQGDNPTFGFLMPHHHLHPYFRYLVDHPEVPKSGDDSKSQEGKTNDIQVSGALSLLGSVYGSGEDEDVATEVDKDSEKAVSVGTSSSADMTNSNQSEQTLSAEAGTLKGETVSVLPQHPKGKVSVQSKYSINSIKPGRASSIKYNGNVSAAIGSNMEKPKALSLFPVSQGETSLVDPPSEMKRLVDRIVEIILKNGQDFETVLIEQDKNHDKFPFLLPSNKYNPYYLRVLKKSQESRISGKTFFPEKDVSSWQELDKSTAHQMKENKSASLDESDCLDLDPDKKEKFKMVIPKPKKDQQDQPSKEPQQRGYTVDTAAAAAILQAATRGIRNPNVNFFSKGSHGFMKEGRPSSGSEHMESSQQQCLALNDNRSSTNTACAENEITKIAASSEVDSNKAELVRQQKLKAERLRRAKMFAAMIKSGAAPLGAEPLRASSSDPPEPKTSGSAVDNVILEVKGNEGSYSSTEVGKSSEMIKSEQNLPNVEIENERQVSKKRHYRSRKHDHRQEQDECDGNEEDSEEDKRQSLKRHKSRHSSHRHRDRSKDRHRHRRRHSSIKREESRHRHKREHSSSIEDDDDDAHNPEKPDYSSEEERKHRKRRHRHDRSSEEESKHHKRRHKRSNRKDKHERSWHESDEDGLRLVKPDYSSEEECKRKRRHKHDSSSEEESKKQRHKRSYRKDKHESSSSRENNDDTDTLHPEKSDYSSEEKHKHRKQRHRHVSSSEEESKHHKRRRKRSHRKDRHTERLRKDDELNAEEVELEEGEIQMRSSDQSPSAIGDDGASREASEVGSKSPHQEKRCPSPPTESTEVPDELRAKIRAMLLATM